MPCWQRIGITADPCCGGCPPLPPADTGEQHSVMIEAPVPVSVNKTRGEHWQVTRRRKRQLQAQLVLLMLAAGVPRPVPGDRIHATARIVHPTNRRRDEGNYRAAMEKALGDALAPHNPDVLHRWLSDDTPEHFTFGAITFAKEAGCTPRCELTLTWTDDEDDDLETAA
jgi:hypothetical protein